MRHDGSTAQSAVLAHIPIDSHFAQRFFGTPPVVGHHGHKGAQVQNLDNAATIFNFGGIQRFDCAIEHRASCNRRMQHAWQLGVNAILALAHHDVWNVDTGNRFANDGPIFGVFELNRFGGF